MAAWQKLIEECHHRPGLDPGETGYVEAHMTGTAIGDHTEAEALAQTFGKNRPASDPVIDASPTSDTLSRLVVSQLSSRLCTCLKLVSVHQTHNNSTRVRQATR